MKVTDIPRTIEECCDYLDEHLNEDIKKFIKENPKEKAEALLHHSLGRRIRNEWGLWRQDSDLFHYLKALGFSHADDMSGIIINFYWRHVHGESWGGLDEEVEKYRKYWAGLSGVVEKIGT